MRAFIKEDKWNRFKEVMNSYGFYIGEYKPNKYFTKVIEDDLLLVINRKTREMQLCTPMGTSPFMEMHIQFYQELYDADFIEFIESKFD